MRRCAGRYRCKDKEILARYLSHYIQGATAHATRGRTRVFRSPRKEIDAPAMPEKKSEKRVPEEKKSEKRKLRASIRKDPVAMAKLKQMHESGAGPFDIADALGYNRKTISGVILGLVEKGVLKKVDRDL